MAIVVESTTTGSGTVTDIGSSGTFLVTKPTGLTVGDMLVAITSLEEVYNGITPSGWTSVTIPSGSVNGNETNLFYKLADSGDVAASNYTFATTDDSGQYKYF